MTKYDILSAMIITENIVARIIRQPFKDTQADPWSVYSQELMNRHGEKERLTSVPILCRITLQNAP